jgi:serine/threonine protein kinase
MDVVRSQYRRLADPRLQLHIVRQMVALVAELHANGVVHRDLKLANMLLEWGPLEVPLLRLCDMGAAKHLLHPSTPPGSRPATAAAAASGSGSGSLAGGAAGALAPLVVESTPYVSSRFYRAPELLGGSSSYGDGVDVWSLATTIAEFYALVAVMNNPRAEAALTSKRGCGAVLRYQEEGKPAPRPHPRHACVLFYGAGGDDSQVAHIINLLGPPSPDDIVGLRLPADHAALLAIIAADVRDAASAAAQAGKANGVPHLDMGTYLRDRMFVAPPVARMLEGMLRWDPRRRLTAAQALTHEALLTEPPYLPHLAGPLTAGAV